MKKMLTVTRASKKDPDKATFTIARLLELFPRKRHVSLKDGDKIEIIFRNSESTAKRRTVFIASRVASSTKRKSGLGTMYGSLPEPLKAPPVGSKIEIEVVDFVKVL